VGAAVARNAWPTRVARDGTLHVATADSIWAFELVQRADEIARRLGVPRVRFAPGGLPGAAPATPAPGRAPSPEDTATARALVAGVDDENLRKSMQKAISFGLACEAARRLV